MSNYDYQHRIKKEDFISDFIDLIRNLSRKIGNVRYIEKEMLDSDDIQLCIDEVLIQLSNLESNPQWLVWNDTLRQSISSFVYNFIKHEHDNFISMGSASSNYWNNMITSRSKLYEILMHQ
jgi:hypothetical protein